MTKWVHSLSRIPLWLLWGFAPMAVAAVMSMLIGAHLGPEAETTSSSAPQAATAYKVAAGETAPAAPALQ